MHHGWPDLRSREDGTLEYRGPLGKTCSCRDAHQTIPPRSQGPPWNSLPLTAFLGTVFRRILHRELPTGKGGFDNVAIGPDENHAGEESESHLDKPSLVPVRHEIQTRHRSAERNAERNLDKPFLVTVRRGSAERNVTQTGKSFIEKERPESDSDVTVPEPSSPQFPKGTPSLAQNRDLPLCKVLNIPREDRCFHMRTHTFAFFNISYEDRCFSHALTFAHSFLCFSYPLASLCVVSARSFFICSFAVITVATGTSTSWTATPWSGA